MKKNTTASLIREKRLQDRRNSLNKKRWDGVKRFLFVFVTYAVYLHGIIYAINEMSFIVTIIRLAFVLAFVFGLPGLATYYTLILKDGKKTNRKKKELNQQKEELIRQEAELNRQKEELIRQEAELNRRKEEFGESAAERKEKELNKREEELNQREAQGKSAIDAYAKRKAEELDNYKMQILAMELRTKSTSEIDQIEKHRAALTRTEHRVYSWLKNREKDEIAAFNEIKEKVDQYQKYATAVPEMDGLKFEEYVAKILLDNGYTDVNVTQKSRDYGADITATYGCARYVFQCKYYSSPVGISAVQEVFSSKAFYSAHIAVVVTNSVFTKAAEILADEVKVILWDGKKLAELTKQHTAADDKADLSAPTSAAPSAGADAQTDVSAAVIV